LRFVAVAHEITYGKHAQVDLSEAKAREALASAASGASRLSTASASGSCARRQARSSWSPSAP